MSESEAGVQQTVSGSGNVFSGTGNVTVGYSAEQVRELPN